MARKVVFASFIASGRVTVGNSVAGCIIVNQMEAWETVKAVI